jgi:hypothetical protein
MPSYDFSQRVRLPNGHYGYVPVVVNLPVRDPRPPTRPVHVETYSFRQGFGPIPSAAPPPPRYDAYEIRRPREERVPQRRFSESAPRRDHFDFDPHPRRVRTQPQPTRAPSPPPRPKVDALALAAKADHLLDGLSPDVRAFFKASGYVVKPPSKDPDAVVLMIKPEQPGGRPQLVLTPRALEVSDVEFGQAVERKLVSWINARLKAGDREAAMEMYRDAANSEGGLSGSVEADFESNFALYASGNPLADHPHRKEVIRILVETAEVKPLSKGKLIKLLEGMAPPLQHMLAPPFLIQRYPHPEKGIAVAMNLKEGSLLFEPILFPNARKLPSSEVRARLGKSIGTLLARLLDEGAVRATPMSWTAWVSAVKADGGKVKNGSSYLDAFIDECSRFATEFNDPRFQRRHACRIEMITRLIAEVLNENRMRQE